jgi:RimJ/RimL family protein N-acetyltransferase
MGSTLWSHEDSRSFSEIFCNPGYLQFGILSRHTSPTYTFRSVLDGLNRDDQAYYIGSLGGADVLALQLSHVDRHNASAEIHLASTPPVWGSGLLAPIGRRMMALFFDELMLHRVYGFTPDWNERLIKTVQLAGARVEGRIRKGWYSDGRWHTTCVIGLLAHEAIYHGRRG